MPDVTRLLTARLFRDSDGWQASSGMDAELRTPRLALLGGHEDGQPCGFSMTAIDGDKGVAIMFVVNSSPIVQVSDGHILSTLGTFCALRDVVIDIFRCHAHKRTPDLKF